MTAALPRISHNDITLFHAVHFRDPGDFAHLKFDLPCHLAKVVL
jgi:hypothetical protein